ncbi:xanthine dehydrogenase family protein molybdopterin-binding subunit [Halobaculum sp. D14]|uniref:xanthine dehydrogenase family protein molybdopterin-binding subunit n=1 Tax=Halobaculum sp. D14 TaxID=3421642 RepID=UPI003EB6D60B
MADNQYVGQDFEIPDGRAKVTGEAKYADDYLFDNALDAKTVKSPYAHAKVQDIDTTAAEQMAGVEAVITYKDVPGTDIGQPILAEEPLVYGYPVAAVAAKDEYTAAAAVEEIDVEYEVLDHVVDPVETLKPGSPNARPEGNAPTGEAGGESAEGQGGATNAVGTIKWKNADFSERFPKNPGKYPLKWSWGDVEKGFEKADHVVEDTVESQPFATNPLEPRSTVAHWQSNGSVKVWGSSQSMSMTHTGLASMIGVSPANLTFINNFTGGGFGSKGTSYPQMGVPALLSKELNRPVKIRGTRKEEFHWGNGRSTLIAKIKVGITDDGTITALDIQGIADSGAYSADALSTLSSAYNSISQCWQPETLRVRGIGVFTNTPKRWPQRGPGQNQGGLVMSQVIDELAEVASIDPLELRMQNTPSQGDPAGPTRAPITSANLKEAYEMAAEDINYEEKRRRSGTVEGSKIYGVGAGTASHHSGYIGFDGLVAVHTDGTVEVRQGAGNLGTESFAAVARMVAETMDVPWDQVKVQWGRSDQASFTLGQFSSNTTFTTGLANVKAAETAMEYLREIASQTLGGAPDDYEVTGGEVVNTQTGDSMTLAQAAQAAVEMGGKYTAETVPTKYQESLVPLTIAAAQDIKGESLVAFGKSTSEDLDGFVTSFAGCIAEVSVDLQTGEVAVEEIANYADSGRIIHPEGHKAQVEGATVQAIGYVLMEHYLHDDDTGIPLNTDFYKNKPPAIQDYSETELKTGGVDNPDPYGPHGAKGVGEPPYGAAAAAVASATRDALGVTFDTFPLSPSEVLEKIQSEEVDI